ncbi:cupin domain-containing protein [Embleya sp. NBC_00896]|uniref:cupin domain-containing protein n=1 Tax=Embleya sp. NBC_00896 TaxID=2975961 RepID=UPI0038641561|nr:cupin domain-containing protein [Embleya sp. NBC_00896]
MPVIRSADVRVTTTPNAVMTTYASPTQGGSVAALWRADMGAAAVGPYHAFDAEQIWTVLTGAFVIDLAGEKLTVGAGDTVVVPADLPRQVYADAETGFTAIVTASASALAYNPNDITPPDACDIAPKEAARVSPPWMA